MGIFSSKTVITVGTAISPLVSEKPNLARSAILRAAFNDWEYTPTIIDALLSGYNIDPRGYYNYGKDEYYYRLPEGHIPQETVKDVQLIDVLAAMHGVLPSDINIVDSDYSPYEDIVAGNWYIANQGTLDIKTGLIADLPFVPDGEVARVNSVEIIETYDNSEGTVGNELISTELVAQLTHFNPNTPNQTTQMEYHTADVTPSSFNLKEFENKAYNTIYKVYDSVNGTYSENLYFIYDTALNTYPELNVLSEEDLDSPYYPVVPVRFNKEWVDDTFPAYNTSVEILKYLNVDMHAIQDALKDNPDVDDVDDSYILLGMPIGREHERDSVDCKYLYRYFEYLASISKVNRSDFEASLSNKRPKFNTINIRDSGFRTSLYWNYVDFHDRSLYDENKAGTYELKYLISSDKSNPSDSNFYSKDYIEIWYHDRATRKVQVVRVSGLYHVSEVYLGKTVVNTIKSVFTADEDERSDGFFLPISEDVMNTLSKREYTHVAFSSLILLNYAVVKTKIKWYQRKAFWRIIQIIIVIVSIYTMQPQLAALATATVSEIAYLIVQSIVVNYLIGEAVGYVLSLLAEVIGGEAAVIIAAIVAAVAAIYGVGGQFNLKLPFADEVLKLSNLMLTEIQKLQNERAKQLQEEISSFKSDYEALKEEIEAARDLLNIDGTFNPYWVLEGSSIIAGESSSDFLLRNTNLNPNELSIQAVTNFTENALRLPTLANVNDNFRGF